MTDAIYRLKRFILLEMLSDIVQQQPPPPNPENDSLGKGFVARSILILDPPRWLNYERMHLIKARFILSGMQFFGKS